MKKFFFTIAVAIALMSCSDSQTDSTTTADTVAATPVTPAEPVMATRTPGDGDVTYEGGKVRVYRNNAWEDSDGDVVMENRVTVYKDGRVVKDDVEYEWEEGYTVDRDGNVWNRTGQALDNAWDATKHGVKETGKAVKHVTKKAGEKIKDAVDRDDK